MLANWPVVLLGMGMVVMTTVSFYLITAYTPTFGKSVLKLGDIEVLIVTVCVGLSNLFWLPVSGALSDRIGRRPLLIGTTLARDPHRLPGDGRGWSAVPPSATCW